MTTRVLAALFPAPESPKHFDASSSLQELAPQAAEPVQVKILLHPSFPEFQQTAREFQPSLVYLCGPSSYEQNKVHGSVDQVQFSDGAQSADALAAACSGVESVFLDAAPLEGIGNKLKAAGVRHAVVWPDGSTIPAVIAAQFSHTFFCCLLCLKATVPEAFALASHVVQAHCTSKSADDKYVPPSLPSLLSPIKAALPDNTSIAPPSLQGVDTSQGLAASVPGWSDIRLLAPRAELRLLLTGNASLIDGHKLSFLGEALRALLVLEMRSLALVSSTPCSKTPANLPLGCTALRCEVRTCSGAQVVAILGGQPSVLADRQLVEHALRMTLVADSLSLQFRLPPPSISQPVTRSSAVIAGNTPLVDALVLTSVWAVNVLRSLCLTASYKPLISLGLAAVGGTATVGVSGVDAQRLKIIVTGQGPATHALEPLPAPAPAGPAGQAGQAAQGSRQGASQDGSLAAQDDSRQQQQHAQQ